MIRKIFWVYTIVLILLAILPINSSGNSINHTYVVSIRLDYVLHFAIFIPWMFLLWKSSGISFKKDSTLAFLIIIASLAFSMVNEGIQYFLPYRAFNINDLLANGLGVSLGSLFFCESFHKYVRKRIV
ncbi:MAG: VanZ family protein [Bacteroidetes bacterium]|nr:VanZ family protein [Bacteroidota bacterium]